MLPKRAFQKMTETTYNSKGSVSCFFPAQNLNVLLLYFIFEILLSEIKTLLFCISVASVDDWSEMGHP